MSIENILRQHCTKMVRFRVRLPPSSPQGEGAAGDLHHRDLWPAIHPRIDAAAEPYPNRWTRHIDEELTGRLKEAAAFSAGVEFVMNGANHHTLIGNDVFFGINKKNVLKDLRPVCYNYRTPIRRRRSSSA